MNKMIVAALSAVLLAGSAHAGAEPADRVDHYEAEQPKGAKEAVTVLNKHTAAIEQVIKNAKLSDADLEKIHENTYSLENSVDELRKHAPKEKQAKIDVLDEAVQALHYASENHEEAKAREWFSKLKPAAKEVASAF